MGGEWERGVVEVWGKVVSAPPPLELIHLARVAFACAFSFCFHIEIDGPSTPRVHRHPPEHRCSFESYTTVFQSGNVNPEPPAPHSNESRDGRQLLVRVTRALAFVPIPPPPVTTTTPASHGGSSPSPGPRDNGGPLCHRRALGLRFQGPGEGPSRIATPPRLPKGSTALPLGGWWTSAEPVPTGGSNYVRLDARPAEWMNYSLNAPTAGAYSFQRPAVANLGSGVSFHSRFDGVQRSSFPSPSPTPGQPL